MRVVIIGAGPVGIVAALWCRARGLEVSVYEKGAIGDALRRWGATRLFTPLAMNVPPDLLARLPKPPPLDALLTGPELATEVLEPLVRAELEGRVHTGHEVIAVGRARMSRGELAGHPLRAERPFRLLVVDNGAAGGERTVEADRVLDASGVYDRVAHVGAGGLPAVGERALGPRLIRHLGELHARLGALGGRHLVLVGHGASAANAIELLTGLLRTAPETRVTWAVRSAQLRPVVEVASDPLPERARLLALANDYAQRPPPGLTIERRAHLEAIAQNGSRLAVTLSGGRRLLVDEAIALTGGRPDLTPLSELTLEISPATEGAARLARALANISDCLAVPAVADADLQSGEPGFFLVGQKSYGRASTFLLQTGYAQLRRIIAEL
jgi:thioredoxin reductase